MGTSRTRRAAGLRRAGRPCGCRCWRSRESGLRSGRSRLRAARASTANGTRASSSSWVPRRCQSVIGAPGVGAGVTYGRYIRPSMRACSRLGCTSSGSRSSSTSWVSASSSRSCPISRSTSGRAAFCYGAVDRRVLADAVRRHRACWVVSRTASGGGRFSSPRCCSTQPGMSCSPSRPATACCSWRGSCRGSRAATSPRRRPTSPTSRAPRSARGAWRCSAWRSASASSSGPRSGGSRRSSRGTPRPASWRPGCRS